MADDPDKYPSFEVMMGRFSFRTKTSTPEDAGGVFLTRRRLVSSALPDDVIEGVCGKKVFHGKKDATTAANRLMRNGRGELKVYHCDICGGDVWHVSSKIAPLYPDKKKKLERHKRKERRSREVDEE